MGESCGLERFCSMCSDMHPVKRLSKNLNHSSGCAPWSQDRDGFCVPLLCWGWGAILWEKTLVLCRVDSRKHLLGGSRQVSLRPFPTTSKSIHLCKRWYSKAENLRVPVFVTSLIYYSSSCSSNSNHWLLFCLSPHLHQGVVGKRTQPGIRPASLCLTVFLGKFTPAF